jgi:hypothetical protein
MSGWARDGEALTRTFTLAGYRPAVDVARLAGLAADCANVPCEVALVPPASVGVRVPGAHPKSAVVCTAIDVVDSRSRSLAD